MGQITSVVEYVVIYLAEHDTAIECFLGPLQLLQSWHWRLFSFFFFLFFWLGLRVLED